jgi:hypothetical protein
MGWIHVAEIRDQWRTQLAGLCNGDVMSPVRYELVFYVPEYGIIYIHIISIVF